MLIKVGRVGRVGAHRRRIPAFVDTPGEFLLLETGTALLLENGSGLPLEGDALSILLAEDGTPLLTESGSYIYLDTPALITDSGETLTTHTGEAIAV